MFENFVYLLLGKDLLIYGPNTQMFKYIVGWDSKNRYYLKSLVRLCQSDPYQGF